MRYVLCPADSARRSESAWRSKNACASGFDRRCACRRTPQEIRAFAEAILERSPTHLSVRSS